MELKKRIMFVLTAFLKLNDIYKILHSPEYQNNRYLGDIIRKTHSIEKGLSLGNIRLGYGYKKIMEGFSFVERYKKNGGNMQAEQIQMFVDALDAYLKFHQGKNYSNEQILDIQSKFSMLTKDVTPTLQNTAGGSLHVNRQDFSPEELKVIDRLFNNRHSVREFAGTPIDEANLKNAIEMAMRCPSACNRQCYRLQIVERKDFNKLDGWVDGVGGFADELDKLLIVTGQLSVYHDDEQYQYAVTSAIFAGYLSLALEAYNIGCCVIQRSLNPSRKWNSIRNNFGIPGDELPVCCLGIGNLKTEYRVPVSHRLNYKTIVRR